MTTPNGDHADILSRGTNGWNRWRSENPTIRPDLSGADLSDLDLPGANLGEADLTDAELCGTNLHEANLKMADLAQADLSTAILTSAELYKVNLRGAFLTQADLTGSYLAEADMAKADLRGACLRKADLTQCDLSSANLSRADLTGANLTQANVTDGDLSHATVAQTQLMGLRYGRPRSMAGHYLGIRGLDSCFGNALFVRDALDQDYLDAMRDSITNTPSPALRRLKQMLFSAWGLIDYGRSLARAAMYAFLLSLLYGSVYLLDLRLGWGLMNYANSAQSWLTPFYYSIVTYTTLGFGDITPKHWLGEIIVISEVLLGYVTLGLLMSILANKVARRS